ACRAGPARRVDAGRAVERIDREPGIVGECGQRGSGRGGERLDTGIVAESRSGFLGLGEPELVCRYGRYAIGGEQLAHLLELAGVVGGDDQTAGNKAMRHRGACAYITASFCRSTSLATPFLASASRFRNCSSLNGVFSAVPCTSTMRPSPVITKLAS